MSNAPAEPQPAATTPDTAREGAAEPSAPPPATQEGAEAVEEIGGPAGPDPTRFGDWERKGRCIDF